MSLLVDWQIHALCDRDEYDSNLNAYRKSGLVWYEDESGKELPMLEPFSPTVSGDGVISYGLTHAGYDLRLADEFVIFTRLSNHLYENPPIIDPKKFNQLGYAETVSHKFTSNVPVTIPPNSYVLGRSVEYIRIPDWLKARCVGKSTYARSGILINTTPLEPGWEGHLCIEIGNCTPLPAVIYPGEGIAQLEFELLDDTPETIYRGKKYQGQTGVTLAKV